MSLLIHIVPVVPVCSLKEPVAVHVYWGLTDQIAAIVGKLYPLFYKGALFRFIPFCRFKRGKIPGKVDRKWRIINNYFGRCCNGSGCSLAVLILSTGIFLMIRYRFSPLLRFGAAFRLTIGSLFVPGRKRKGTGDISLIRP